MVDIVAMVDMVAMVDKVAMVDMCHKHTLANLDTISKGSSPTTSMCNQISNRQGGISISEQFFWQICWQIFCFSESGTNIQI